MPARIWSQAPAKLANIARSYGFRNSLSKNTILTIAQKRGIKSDWMSPFEALKETIRGKKASIAEIIKYAEICRVKKIMMPYMEAMVVV